MKSTKINYGLIGAGHIGNYHVQQAKQILSINFIGLFDKNSHQGNKVATTHQVKLFNNLEELVVSCDAVSIATPASTHFKIARLALQHGCHVFIEKPITTNLIEADQLIKLAKERGLLVQVGHIERFNPVFVRFLNLCPDNNPKFIEIHRLAPFNLRGTDTNVILDLMIHDIDLVCALMEGAVSNVFATGINILTNSLDLVNARLEFNNGSVANLTASRISATSMRKIRIFEKSQYSSLDLQNHSINQYVIQRVAGKSKVSKKSIEVTKKNALFEELVSFVNCIIESKQRCTVSAEDGRRALEVALLIQDKIDEQK